MTVDVIACETLVRVLTGLSEYTVLHATESNNELIIEVIATRLEAACPGCGEFSTRLKSVRVQTVRDVASAGRPCTLTVRKRAFRCAALGCVRRSFTQNTTEIPALKRVTARCRELIGRAGKDRSTAAVAREFGVSWSTAWNAVVTVAIRELAARPRIIPAVFGIDETRFTRRQSWLTGTVDLRTSELIAMFTGRTATDLAGWLDTLTSEEKLGVIAVVIDPHAGYRAALRSCLPDAVIVGDRFHFEQHTGRAVTDVRRRRIWEQAQHRGRKADPGWRARHDLLRRHDRLTPKGLARLLKALHADTQNPDDPIGELAYAYVAPTISTRFIRPRPAANTRTGCLSAGISSLPSTQSKSWSSSPKRSPHGKTSSSTTSITASPTAQQKAGTEPSKPQKEPGTATATPPTTPSNANTKHSE